MSLFEHNEIDLWLWCFFMLAEESFHLVCDNVHSAVKFRLEVFVFNPCGHFRGSMDNSAILFAQIETCLWDDMVSIPFQITALPTLSDGGLLNWDASAFWWSVGNVSESLPLPICLTIFWNKDILLPVWTQHALIPKTRIRRAGLHYCHNLP